MKAITITISSIILVFIYGCTGDSTTTYKYYTESPVWEKSIRFYEVDIDTLILEDVSSSYSGFTKFVNGNIHFIDSRFGWLYIFDNEGNLLERTMGQGHGPKEIPMAGIQFVDSRADNGYIMIGSSYDYYEFDEELNRVNNGIIRWIRNHPIEYLHQNPIPEAQRSYNLAYDTSNIQVFGEYAYLPLFSASPMFSNFHMFTDLYASEARILAELNLNTSEVERIFGRLPPLYIKDRSVRAFSVFDFQIMPNGEFKLAFAADSLIHVFDKDFTHLRSFGKAGKYMDYNFTELANYDNESELQRYMMRKISMRDYHTTISCLHEMNLCFRSYRIASGLDYDGLQIYENDVLIGDVRVPATGDYRNFNFFRVIGHKEPWFYSNILFDEENEQKMIFRFKWESE